MSPTTRAAVPLTANQGDDSPMPPVTLSVTIPGVRVDGENTSKPYNATYKYEAPDNLLGQFPVSPDNIDRFMSEFEPFCRDTVERDFSCTCVSCHKVPARLFEIMTLGSFSNPNNLRVKAFCVPHCGEPKCEFTAKQVGQSFATQCNNVLHEDCPEKQSSITQHCHKCGKVQPEQKLVCAQCNVAFYCNKACQRKHWPKHKPVCKASQEGRFSIDFSAN